MTGERGERNEALPASRPPRDAGERVWLADDYQSLFPEDYIHDHWSAYMRRLERSDP